MQFALNSKCFPHPQGLHSGIGQLTGFSKMLYEFLVYFVLIIKAWVLFATMKPCNIVMVTSQNKP
jgi:cell division protein FtsL